MSSFNKTIAALSENGAGIFAVAAASVDHRELAAGLDNSLGMSFGLDQPKVGMTYGM